MPGVSTQTWSASGMASSMPLNHGVATTRPQKKNSYHEFQDCSATKTKLRSRKALGVALIADNMKNNLRTKRSLSSSQLGDCFLSDVHERPGKLQYLIEAVVCRVQHAAFLAAAGHGACLDDSSHHAVHQSRTAAQIHSFADAVPRPGLVQHDMAPILDEAKYVCIHKLTYV